MFKFLNYTFLVLDHKFLMFRTNILTPLLALRVDWSSPVE